MRIIYSLLFLFFMPLVMDQNDVIFNEEEAKSTLKETSSSSNDLVVTVNGISFEMVYACGGSFTMGYTEEGGTDRQFNEKPSHIVNLDSYYIGKYEVIQALWEVVKGNNPSYISGINLPIEQVSWTDVQDFIIRLNKLAGEKFRLPTEAEWEFAARGGVNSSGFKYSGADNLDIVGWYGDNSGNKLHAVGTKLPNELGIYDMSGNIWEWCSDWYEEYSSSTQTNPKGGSFGECRVFRGGSWFNEAYLSRVSFRGCAEPSDSSRDLGFRLAL